MEDKIFNLVKASKKYGSICDETIYRICCEEFPKYKKEKDVVKSVKNKLHQISQSYMSDGFSRFLKCLGNNESVDFTELMKLHSSTNERLSFYNEFYDDIFSVVGSVGSILDIACGLNPIMLGEYLLKNDYKLEAYIAEDININALEAVKCYYDKTNRPVVVNASDLLTKIPKVSVDVALMLKLVPLLEQQKKDYYKHVLNELSAKFVVVSFPLTTMSGKSVGMLGNYKSLFDDFLVSGNFRLLFTKVYDNELLYVITKKM